MGGAWPVVLSPSSLHVGRCDSAQSPPAREHQARHSEVRSSGASRGRVVGSIRDRIAAQQNVARMLSSFGFEPSARARMGLTSVQAVRSWNRCGRKPDLEMAHRRGISLRRYRASSASIGEWPLSSISPLGSSAIEGDSRSRVLADS